MTENADSLVPENKDKSSGVENPSGRNARDRRTGNTRRESVVDRRSGLDRRDCPSGLKLPDMETRRGAGIRRPEDRRSAEEGELTTEQFEFVMAIEEYKRANHKTFPTWTEVLKVVKILGYRKENGGEESSANSEDSTIED
ncbi:MAG: hypothetical protein WC975_09515 [Phycisphaerae bacterium]